MSPSKQHKCVFVSLHFSVEVTQHDIRWREIPAIHEQFVSTFVVHFLMLLDTTGVQTNSQSKIVSRVNLNKAAKLPAPAGSPSMKTERLEFGEMLVKQPISVCTRRVSTPLAKQQPVSARFLLASPWATFVRTHTTRKHETLTAASVCAGGCHRSVGAGRAQGSAARSRVASVSRSLAAC